jgi:hypothetical protein
MTLMAEELLLLLLDDETGELRGSGPRPRTRGGRRRVLSGVLTRRRVS